MICLISLLSVGELVLINTKVLCCCCVLQLTDYLGLLTCDTAVHMDHQYMIAFFFSFKDPDKI